MSATDLNPTVVRQYFPPAPNPMFTPLMTACILFARYASAVPCAHCGRRSKHHWTAHVRFKATDIESGLFTLIWPRKWLQRGAPVCRKHILHLDVGAMHRLMKAAKKKK